MASRSTEALVVVPDAESLDSLPPQPAAISASVMTVPPRISALAVIRIPGARLCLIIKPPPVGERAAPIRDHPDRAGLRLSAAVGPLPLDPVCTPLSHDVELSASCTSVLVTCQARDDLTTALGTAQLAGSPAEGTRRGAPPESLSLVDAADDRAAKRFGNVRADGRDVTNRRPPNACVRLRAGSSGRRRWRRPSRALPCWRSSGPWRPGRSRCR